MIATSLIRATPRWAPPAARIAQSCTLGAGKVKGRALCTECRGLRRRFPERRLPRHAAVSSDCLSTTPTPTSTFRRLLGFAAAHRSLLAWSIVLALAAQAFALAIPSFTGRAIDDAIRPHDRSSLWLWVWLIVGAGRGQRRAHGRPAPDTSGRLLAEHRSRGLRQITLPPLRASPSGSTTSARTASFFARDQSWTARSRCSSTSVYIFITRVRCVADRAPCCSCSRLAAHADHVRAAAPIADRRDPLLRRSHPMLRDVQRRIADVTTQAEGSIVGVRVTKPSRRRTPRARASPSAPSRCSSAGSTPRASRRAPPAARPPPPARLRRDHPGRRPARGGRGALAAASSPATSTSHS